MVGFSFELIELIADKCDSAKDVAALASVSQLYHAAVIRILYRHIVFRGPRQYASFVGHLDNFYAKGWLSHVRRIDLSSYTTRGSGWTEAKAKMIVDPNVLAKLLIQCSNLRELFVGEEMIRAFVVPTVIRAIFTGHPYLEVLDFSGFCDRKFTAAMALVFGDADKQTENILASESTLPPVFQPKDETDALDSLLFQATQSAATLPSEIPDTVTIPPKLNRLSFYMCMSLSESSFFVPFFERLARGGNQLTRLDLANTKVTHNVFSYINPSAITHINLQSCHGITCCSEFIPFIQRCTQLYELNLDMHFNGAPATNFCANCLSHLLSIDFPMLRVWNLGGHANLDDQVLRCFSKRVLRQLEYFSVACAMRISTQALLSTVSQMAHLQYLNVSRTIFTTDVTRLLEILNALLSSTFQAIKVIEISPETMRYPAQHQSWTLISHGRRSYYSRDGVDPRFMYANKLPMLDGIPTSPMTKYWSYSC